jgi:hypothetical protein
LPDELLFEVLHTKIKQIIMFDKFSFGLFAWLTCVYVQCDFHE